MSRITYLYLDRYNMNMVTVVLSNEVSNTAIPNIDVYNILKTKFTLV